MESTNKQTTFIYVLSLLKNSFAFIFFFSLGYFGLGQSQYSYYIVEKPGHSLTPFTKVLNSNGTLTLTFPNPTMNIFFQTKTIYKYEKAFPSAPAGNYLSRVYEITVLNPNLVSELSNLTDVELAEEVPIEFPGYDPNDPYFATDNQLINQLGLVRASKAWHISHGNAIIVGIADDNFDINHEDLANQIINHVENSNNPSHHGTKVAGMVGAHTDNAKGISAVGFNVKLYTKEIIGANSLLALAQEPGVRIINYSYGGCSYSSIQAELYRQIRQDYDVLLLACAGNGVGWACVTNSEQYVYPASYDHVVSVSSIGYLFPIEHGITNWKDVHKRYPLNPNSSTHQHNDKVDIVAPGYSVRTTHPNNNYGLSSGTSYATPMVAGAASLVLSVKPDLTADELENILKLTADDIYWIPYNQPYIGKLGTGRLNVFRAVKTAECLDESNPTVELVVRDSNEDIGNEPNSQSSYFWKSNDIWVRNQDDGKYDDTHQNVEYSPSNPNYAYVRVTNYGCQTSSGEDELKLYWSYAGTSQSWPNGWNGVSLAGGPIGTVTIPELAPGQETILEFEWYPPNPNNYPGSFPINGNFSLLARIISDDDPITYVNGSNISSYVKQNNNVAWKNINVLDISPLSPKISAAFVISNDTEEIQTYSLKLTEENASMEKGIYKEAEITIIMDSLLYDKWVVGGSSFSEIDSTKNPNAVIVSGSSPELNNLILTPGESGTIEFTFNFLTKELIDKKVYEYNIIQRNNSNGEIVGGATILINKENRNSVVADAEITKHFNSTTLIAETIGEPAVYNWYDSEGNLIYTGTELTVSPELTKIYKLEVISDLDGFKDYKEVEVSGNNLYSLGTLVPNPAISQVTISYEASSATSAYIIITNTLTAGSENYILNTSVNQINVNLSNYPTGIYTVTLICNGVVVDSKNLIKN